MFKKINNYHIFILILIVFILNTILFKSIDITKAQWKGPSASPSEQLTNIVVNPLQEDLDLGGNSILGDGNIDIDGSGYFSGPVGIGTTIPNYPLHIETNTNDNPVFDNTNHAQILLKTTGQYHGEANITLSTDTISAAPWQIFVDDHSGNNIPPDALTIWKDDAVMTFRDTGRVGIGTTEPTHNLEIEGSGDVGLLIKSTTLNDAEIDLENNVLRWKISNDDTYDTNLHIYNHLKDENGEFLGANTVMLLDKYGNVGIGTTQPEAKLDVSGNINVDGDTEITGDIRVVNDVIIGGIIKATQNWVNGWGSSHLTHLPWFNLGQAEEGPWYPGYIKLKTPIVHNESNMFSIKIKGYRYGTGGTPVEIRCGGYAYGASTLIAAKCNTEGTSDPVGIGVEDNKVIITIGSGGSSWYYDHFTAEYSGWQGKNPDDFVWEFVPNSSPPTTNQNNVIINDADGTVTAFNINSSDLNLSNENRDPNEVDGTRGSWTIQEGAEKLFLINRNTGKKYNFILNEIK